MNRPEWFKCETCLWFANPHDNAPLPLQWCYCDSHRHHHEDDIKFVHPNSFCNNWICARCWQGWDSVGRNFRTTDNLFGIIIADEYVDHTKCAPVQFEGEE